MSRDTYECPKCSWSEFPDFVLGEAGRLVAKCRNCLFTEKPLGPADFGRGVAAMPGDDGGGAPGWTGKTEVAVDVAGASPVVDPRGTPAVARRLYANDRRRAIVERIAVQHCALDALKATAGISQYLDDRAEGILTRLEAAWRQDPAQRDLARRLLRDAGATLAAARRAKETDTTAETLADEIIENSARAPAAIPFGSRLPAVRAELAAAIEASGRHDGPKTRRAFLLALGFPPLSKEGERSLRKRLSNRGRGT